LLPFLEEGADLIIEMTPLGDIRTIITDSPEIAAGLVEILQIASSEGERMAKLQSEAGRLGVHRLSTDSGASNEPCENKPLRAGSFRNPLGR
jgi:hypothetical protein